MEGISRPINVIRTDLVRAKDEFAALSSDAGGTVQSYARDRVIRLAEELRATEDATDRLAKTVALKWIYRYASGKRLAIQQYANQCYPDLHLDSVGLGAHEGLEP